MKNQEEWFTWYVLLLYLPSTGDKIAHFPSLAEKCWRDVETKLSRVLPEYPKCIIPKIYTGRPGLFMLARDADDQYTPCRGCLQRPRRLLPR